MSDHLQQQVEQLMAWASHAGFALCAVEIIEASQRAGFNTSYVVQAVAFGQLESVWAKLGEEAKERIVSRIGHLIDHDTGAAA